ncbi:MAG: hypothetical protein K9N29_08450 [Candidatus Marinimicrobia bacterium]|nr:hypothetical protein [Candidatus Neomarinimicrobiota bacterium]
MISVTHSTLKILAAITWYLGVFILISKGSELAGDARELAPDQRGHGLAWIFGILIGMVKTRFIFIKSNKKNLARISALKDPKLWQFFRLRFFIALGLMVLLGAILSRVSQGNYFFLLSVATLDISIGTALLLSSWEFWRPGSVFGLKL